MQPQCILIATLNARPEKRAELLEILNGFVKPTRTEEGCVAYHLHVSDEDPERVRLLRGLADEEAAR